MRLPPVCLIVLVGPSGSGKSHWAARNFAPEQILSSDALRATVGAGEDDMRASPDAFELLDLILARRLGRRLLTVVDTLGLDARRRAAYLESARKHKVACHAVMFDTPAELCKTRNRGRATAVPPKVLTAQIASFEEVASHIEAEGFDAVHTATEDPVQFAGSEMLASSTYASAGREGTTPLRFGLHFSSYGDARDAAPIPQRLAEAVAVAEAVGFSSLWVQDHVVQIPQVGRPWEDMLESWTTLAWLASHTRTARIGPLVSNVTLRNPAHLAKIAATIDVLSGGRAVCGVGLGWWEWENRTFGWEWPSTRKRYDLLEDTLQLLPLMWGPGSPSYKGRTLKVSEAICYPRPLQDPIPILLGGSGERRTLALAARYADACNLFGDAPTVAHKVQVLRKHCENVGRDPASVKVTHLSTAVVRGSSREVSVAVDQLGRSNAVPGHEIERLGAGTIGDQIGRYQRLAEAGVETAIVALPDAFTPGAIESFGRVIEAFDAPASRRW